MSKKKNTKKTETIEEHNADYYCEQSLTATASLLRINGARMRKLVNEGHVGKSVKKLSANKRVCIPVEFAWEWNNRPRKNAKGGPMKPAYLPPGVEAREPVVIEPSEYDLGELPKEFAEDYQGKPPKRAISQEVHEHIKAKTALVDYGVKTGELIERQKVYEVAFESGRKIRDNLFSIPPRLAATLAAETDEHKIETILRKEISQAAKDLPDENRPNFD